MNIRAGGALTARNGRIAPASAKNTPGDAPARAAAAAHAAKPHIAAVAARPSLPSMKLNRFADQTSASATAPTTAPWSGPGSGTRRDDRQRDGEGCRHLHEEARERRHAAPIVLQRDQRNRGEREHPGMTSGHRRGREKRHRDESGPDRESAHAGRRPIVQGPVIGDRVRQSWRTAQKHGDGQRRDDHRQNRRGDRGKGRLEVHREGRAVVHQRWSTANVLAAQNASGARPRSCLQWRGRRFQDTFPQPMVSAYRTGNSPSATAGGGHNFILVAF